MKSFERVCLLVVICITSILTVRLYSAAETGRHPITSTTHAKVRADSITGIAALTRDQPIQADEILIGQLDDSTTPFLRDFTDGLAVWSVVYKNVAMDWFALEKDTSIPPFNLYVVLDSTSGKLLKIECSNSARSSESEPVLIATEAESQIRSKGEEYLGIPYGQPKTSFFDALRALPQSPFDAREIIGQYILYSYQYIDTKSSQRKSATPKEVWIISMIGVPRIELMGGPSDGIPYYMLNRIRYFVNANTGRVWISRLGPSEKLRPEDHKRLFGDPDQE